MTLEDYRRFYAEEIRISANIRDTKLLQAFATVHREDYLGQPPWHICSGDQSALILLGSTNDLYTSTDDPRDLYHNTLIAIDPTRNLNNGHPGSLAGWIAELDLKPGARVYHAGCGVGYYTAILAEMVGPQGQVVAIELDPDLAARARQNLSRYPYVTVHAGDGAAFDPGPCDAMLINAGVTHPHPTWLYRLQPDGVIVLPVTVKAGEHHSAGVMIKIVREAAGFSARVTTFVSIFSFSSLRDPEIEALLAPALSKLTLFKLRSLLLNHHAPTETCLVHTPQLCFSSAPL